MFFFTCLTTHIHTHTHTPTLAQRLIGKLSGDSTPSESQEALLKACSFVKTVVKYIDEKKGEDQAIEQVTVLYNQIGNAWVRSI